MWPFKNELYCCATRYIASWQNTACWVYLYATNRIQKGGLVSWHIPVHVQGKSHRRLFTADQLGCKRQHKTSRRLCLNREYFRWVHLNGWSERSVSERAVTLRARVGVARRLYVCMPGITPGSQSQSERVHDIWCLITVRLKCIIYLVYFS